MRPFPYNGVVITRAATRKPHLVLALLMAFGLIAAACGGDDTTSVESSSAGSDTEANTESRDGDVAGDAPESAAQSVVLPTVGGGQIDLGSVEGTDTILWFWAPW